MASDAAPGGEAMLVLCTLELLFLFYMWKLKKATWELLWIISLECFSYGIQSLVPDAPFLSLSLANGRDIPWLRYMGWLLTCPVLLMGLVSMGTMGNQPAKVKLVPVLVANLVMILLGITAASIDETGVQRIIFALAVAAGGVVFISAGQVFLNLFLFLNQYSSTDPDGLFAARRAKCVSLALCTIFFTGWLLFPIAFALGPKFGNRISNKRENLIYFVGDCFSKNTYVMLVLLFKNCFFKALPFIQAVTPLEAGSRRRPRASRSGSIPPSELIVQEMLQMLQDQSNLASRSASPEIMRRTPSQSTICNPALAQAREDSPAFHSFDKSQLGTPPSGTPHPSGTPLQPVWHGSPHTKTNYSDSDADSVRQASSANVTPLFQRREGDGEQGTASAPDGLAPNGTRALVGGIPERPPARSQFSPSLAPEEVLAAHLRTEAGIQALVRAAAHLPPPDDLGAYSHSAPPVRPPMDSQSQQPQTDRAASANDNLGARPGWGANWTSLWA